MSLAGKPARSETLNNNLSLQSTVMNVLPQHQQSKSLLLFSRKK